MRPSGTSMLDVCCKMPPVCRPRFVAAHTATNSATSPIKRGMRPLNYPPTPYATMSTIGKMSIHVTWRFSRNSTPRRAQTAPVSLSEPGSVSFLQSQLDLRHHLIHFGVRQGALRASESQGKRDALVTLGNLGAAVLVERPDVLQKIAGHLFDGGMQHPGRHRLVHDHRQVALHPRESRQRLCARDARFGNHRFHVDLERDDPSVDPGSCGHGRMELADVTELAAVQHDRCAPARVKRSEEHTSELQSRQYLVCRLLLEKK